MHSVMWRRVISSTFFLFFCIRIFAQNSIPALERTVTLKVTDMPVSLVLNKVAEQTGVQFSYSPSFISVDRKLTFTVSQKPVRTVLLILFGESVQYKQKGNFIILTAKPTTSKPVEVKQVVISGYVYNDNGEKLTSASILNKREHIAAVTNQYGYYRMEIPANKFPVELKVEKENYQDTIVKVTSQRTAIDVTLVSYIVPVEEEVIPPVIPVSDTTAVKTMPDTVVVASTDTLTQSTKKKKFLEGFLFSNEVKANMRNIKDTLFSNVQIGLVPYVSTNSLLAGNTVNNVSINLLIGYSQGVKKAEFGGLMNIDRENVQFFQAAGLINAVGGNVRGAQLAGWANVNAGRGEGFRAAGITNIGHHMDGVQLAGIVNVSANFTSIKHFGDIILDTVKGIEAAGLLNVNAGYVEGVKLAGLCNIGYTFNGVQCAGLLNVNAGYVRGGQVAGLINATVGKTKGAQIAGLINIAPNDVEGVQLTSILNIAGRIKGVQLALINVADSVDGVPLGLLSIVHQGYHKVELFGDEVIHTQLSLRTGVNHFHNIFLAGVDMTDRLDGLWTFGYGIGATFNMTKNWNISGDIISQVLLVKDDVEHAPYLNSLFIGVERSFGKKFSIALGPAYRVLVTTQQSEVALAIADKVVPYTFYDKTVDNGPNFKMWVGGKLSLKFL